MGVEKTAVRYPKLHPGKHTIFFKTLWILFCSVPRYSSKVRAGVMSQKL